MRHLPRGPRTARILTLAVLAATAVASSSLSLALLPEVRYSLAATTPEDVGALADLELGGSTQGPSANRWVRGSGAVADIAVRYRRPLDGDDYRLARIEGNDRLWVQMRIPEGTAAEHFVPPASFVGRLLPIQAAGLRYGRLEQALKEVGAPPQGSWLLIDGEAPATTRWSLALLALFVWFTAFCVYGLVRLTRPVRDANP